MSQILVSQENIVSSAYENRKRKQESGTLVKVDCPKCGKCISKSNLARHQSTNMCSKNIKKYENKKPSTIQIIKNDSVKKPCKICGKNISISNLARHKRSKKCIPRAFDAISRNPNSSSMRFSPLGDPRPEHSKKIPQCEKTKLELNSLLSKHAKVPKKLVNISKPEMNNIALGGVIRKATKPQSPGVRSRPLSVNSLSPLPPRSSPLPTTPNVSSAEQDVFAILARYTQVPTLISPIRDIPDTPPIRPLPSRTLPSPISPSLESVIFQPPKRVEHLDRHKIISILGPYPYEGTKGREL